MVRHRRNWRPVEPRLLLTLWRRSAFQGIYGGLTNAANAAQFIAKLEEKSGVTLPPSDHDAAGTATAIRPRRN